jgi:hypothetical protein
VFGGDVVDRGDGDLRILRDLMQLKRAYPTRVHFILGNRDLNKVPPPSTTPDECVHLPIALHLWFLRTYTPPRLFVLPPTPLSCVSSLNFSMI